MPSVPSSLLHVLRAAVALLPLVLLHTAPAAAIVDVDVTSCGQTIDSGTRGRLVGDLDCSAYPGTGYDGALVVLRGAQLDLAGFTLTVRSGAYGVVCGEPCGEGSIARCKSTCKVTGSGGSIVGAGVGIVAASLDVRDVTITGADTAIGSWRKLLVRRVTLVDNVAWGIFGAGPGLKPKIYDSSITNSGTGVNTGYGVVLKRSTVTGNAYGDLVTSRRPKLVDSTCGVSLGAPGGGSWGVCTAD